MKKIISAFFVFFIDVPNPGGFKKRGLLLLGVALLLFASPSQGISQSLEASPEIPEDPRGTFFLTPEERAWLEGLPPLSLGIDPAWPPMEFVDSQGVHSGISSSYVDLLRRALSIDIRPVYFPSWEKTLEAAKDGSVDMLSTAVRTPEREEFLLFSQPYVSVCTLVVAHVEDPFVENLDNIQHTSLGIQRSSWGVDHISRNYPGISFRFYDSSREVLEGIRRREVAYGFINRGAFQYFRKMKRYAEIRTAFETPYPAEPSMALRKDLVPLIPIMDRFFSSLPATTHDMILERWINIPPGSLSPWKEVLPWLAWGGGLLLLLLGGILAWNRKLSREILRRRRAEEERREAHQMLQAVLENVPVCIYWKDIHSCYLGGNAAFLRYSGIESQESLVGKTDFAMPWKRSAPMLHKEDTFLLEERRPLLSEEREIIMEDQSSRWIRFAKTPLKDSGGTIQGVLGVFEDITEQKEIRLALQEREENYRNLFASSRDAILISDIESGLFLDCNPAALEMFQLSSLEEFRRIGPAQLSTPVQRGGVPLQEAFERLMNELHHRGGYSGEWIHCRKDRTPFPVEIALSLFPYGGRECILGIVRDLSERVRMEEELRSSREWLLTILDNLETVIFVKDREGRYLHANRRFLEVLGVSREETLGRTNEEIWASKPIPNRDATTEDRGVFTSLKPIKAEHPIRHGDGSIHSYLTAKTPLLNHEGVPYALVGEARDISSIKEMQRQIERARDEAEKANQAKSEFLANMSHEIRTPLHAMIGMAHLLQETVISSEQRDYVMHIHRAGQLLIATINNILDLSKIEAQQMTLEKLPLDLEEVLGNAAMMLHGIAEEKDLFIEVHLDPQIPRKLQGDGMRLLQILNNLLSNAIKFTPKGYILLSAEILREEEAKLHIRITVSDTGIGIPKELQKKLFQAFTQADGSITRKYGGTGLGLTICRSLAQLMGGTIKLTSSPGRGSSFTLDLPFERGEASETLYEPFRTSPEKPRKILVASEDSRSSRRLSRYLLATGYEVERASTWGDLAEAIEERVWDLLLVEERFHSAWPLSCLELRDIHAPGIPVILIGGKKSPEEKGGFERRNYLFTLERPLIPGELLEILGDILENRKPLKRDLLLSKHEAAVAVAEAPDLRGRRILVVEDNPINRHLLRKLLEKRGLQVSLAENGEQGVQRVREELFDAVLMDIQMPVMDGLEATRIIRKEEKSQGCRLPILAMTAHALSCDYEKSLEAGMDDHLTKPINPGELCAALGKWILKNKTDRADKPAADTKPPREEGLASADLPSDMEELPEDLRSLKHVDLSRGLAIAEGNLELYRTLLQIFLEEFAQAPLQLQAFTEEEKQGADSPLLRLAHAIKGSGANIGARDLARSAATLVDHLRQVPPEPEGKSREMQDSLEEALLLDLQGLLEELQRLASLTPE